VVQVLPHSAQEQDQIQFLAQLLQQEEVNKDQLEQEEGLAELVVQEQLQYQDRVQFVLEDQVIHLLLVHLKVILVDQVVEQVLKTKAVVEVELVEQEVMVLDQQEDKVE
tara:strand:- start:167 stop:493 length:327 start_codon:yes stop_codon:yes gene_type:complete